MIGSGHKFFPNVSDAWVAGAELTQTITEKRSGKKFAFMSRSLLRSKANEIWMRS